MKNSLHNSETRKRLIRAKAAAMLHLRGRCDCRKTKNTTRRMARACIVPSTTEAGAQAMRERVWHDARREWQRTLEAQGICG